MAETGVRRVWAALILVGLCGCGGTPPPSGPSAPASALQALLDDVGSGRLGDVGAILIARGDTLLAERYFRGQTRDAVVPVYSVTKSVTSLLVGLAIDDGRIPSVDTPLAALLPDYSSLLGADSRRERLTLRDLLTMQAGIAWDEFLAPYDDPRNPVQRMLASPNWVGYVLSQPMARSAGEAFAYNSGATVVIGHAVAQSVGRSLRDYAQDRLFAPLRIPTPSWHYGPLGIANAGSGLSLRAIDLLTLGRVVLERGRYGGVRIISEQWIDESTAPSTASSLGTRYGYQWWRLGPEGRFDPARPVIAAIGWGGQTILILPDDDLVAVVSASNFSRDALVFTQELVRRLRPVAAEAR